MEIKKPRFKPDESTVGDDGLVDCYWCEKRFLPEQMRQERKYDTSVYVCKECQ
jgi:hypothetical protein